MPPSPSFEITPPNVWPHDGDIVVPVKARLLVHKAQGMHEFMGNHSNLEAFGALERYSLPSPTRTKAQMTGLQHAIHENRLKLEKVKRQRLRVEEETINTRETERRMELVLVNSRSVDVLQQLGQMLQEEKRLSEQLTGQASEDRYGAIAVCTEKEDINV
ncbi:hypothetical protein INR49_005307 [Caranx melampygus]|nr:hypothetical protein INR49_005307 [Caranx melampygus]